LKLLNFCRHQYEYVVEGHRFVFNNVVLFLHRMLRYPEPGPTGLDGTLPSFDMLKPLDPSGGYLFQASVLLADGANPAIVNLGLSEIDAAKARLKGVVNLDIPDRLALDTRVK
jgi:mediator of RNA polymerase II transcription subunit 18